MPNLINYNLKKIPTKKWGLLHEFSVLPEFNDNDDWTTFSYVCVTKEAPFSSANREILKSVVEPWMRSIVEIGVSRDGWDVSSTKVLFDNKHPDCDYVGIDAEDRSWACAKTTNARFLQNSSWDVVNNLQFIMSTGHQWIDLLFIDGDHSVNSVLKEWDYAKLVRPNGGVIVLHDTNFHPGPWCLAESVDPELFTVSKFCETPDDFGITVLRRK